MFYDLNLHADGRDDHSRRELIATAIQLGFDGIAVNHTVSGQMDATDVCSIVTEYGMSELVAAAPGVANGARFHQRLLKEPLSHKFQQLTRITVTVNDTVQASSVNPANPVLQSYDLVAVQPTNQKMFARACTNLEADIISLDLSSRLPLRFHRPTVVAAMKRGIFFEIQYSGALGQGADRRQLFANAQSLLNMTRGRHIIITSGAMEALDMRGPYDIASLSVGFGLDMERAIQAISENCNCVMAHGEARRNVYKRTVKVQMQNKKPSMSSYDSLSVERPILLSSSSNEDGKTSSPLKNQSENSIERLIAHVPSRVGPSKNKAEIFKIPSNW